MACGRSQQIHKIPVPTLQHPSPVEWQHPQTAFASNKKEMAGYTDSPPLMDDIENECYRFFNEYLARAVQNFGRIDDNIYWSVHEELKHGYKRYVTEVPGCTLSGYISLLQALHHLSILRSAWLRGMLLGPYHNC